MSQSNKTVSADLAAQLSALVTPMQGTSTMLANLAASLTSAVASVTQTGEGQGLAVPAVADGVGESGDKPTKPKEGENEGEQPEGLFSKFTDAIGATEQLDSLKDTWDDYYKGLFDSEKKLKKEKAASLAFEIGATIAGTKKMAKVRKALAIGNIVKSTAEAVMVAAKSAPFPMNLLPIGKAVAIGAQQLSTVKGQAHAGLKNVPSTGTYLLEKGERVVGNRLNRDLEGYLAAQETTREVAGNTVNNSPSINLTINGDASGDAVASNRGALEGMIRDIFADYAMDAPFG